MATPLYALTEADAAVLRRVLANARGTPGTPAQQTPQIRQPTNRLYLAVTSSIITAYGSASSVGKGTAYIYWLNPTQELIYPYYDGGGTGNKIELDVWNIFSVAIPTGVFIFIAEDVNGTYWVISEDCN